MSDLKVVIKLKDVLKERSMSQKELAELSGLRPNTISILTRGYIDRLSLSHVERIASALNIYDISELIELVPKTNSNDFSVDDNTKDDLH